MSSAQDFTVLVVDDEEDVREYLSELLEDAGFQVRMAADGVEALEIVKTQPPDFISLDLVMPNKSGIRFLYELRHNKAWAKIPFMVVTAHAHDDLGGNDLKDILATTSISGPQTYLEKPVEPETYVGAVCERLGVEIETDLATANSDELLDEVGKLLADADRETLLQLVKTLKRKA
jgi:CheY-like chemotaxis protein